MKKLIPNNSSPKFWLWVIGSALVIAVLWATIFYPTSLKRSGVSSSQEFGDFQTKLKDAFSIFKKKTPETSNQVPDAEIQDLRERVFGDSVKRK